MNRDEIALERRIVVGERTERTGRTWDRAQRLARLELGQTWPSYLSGVLLALLIGLFAVSLLWAAPEPAGDEGLPTNLLIDSLFVFVLANLGINWTSTNWVYLHTDPFTPRLSFLRALPIPIRDLILGRLMIVLATTTVTSLVFFAPSYALFSPLRAEIPPTQYLWFALFWIGYILLFGGMMLFLELGMKGRATLIACLASAVLLLAIVVLAQVSGNPLVRGSLELVGAYGPLVAVPALAAGGGGLLLWCRLLERRLRTRELAS